MLIITANSGVPGQPVPERAALIAGEDPNGLLRSLTVDLDGRLDVLDRAGRLLGQVSVSQLPALVLAAGNAQIGHVVVDQLPAVTLGAGSASIGSVTLGGPLPAGTNQIGSVALAANSIVGLASGTTVALASNTSVSLANGTTVGLAAGTTIGLAANTTVALASGTTVALASGTTVGLSANTTVGLNAGTNMIGHVVVDQLPTGLATTTLQTTGNASLASILAALASPVPAGTLTAAAARAGTLFGATSGDVAMTGSLIPVAVLQNPTGSGRTIYVSEISAGAGLQVVCRRYRNPTVAGGTAASVVNEGGGSATPVGKLLTSPTLSNGTIDSTDLLYQPGVRSAEFPDGAIILPQGTSLAWMMGNTATLATLVGTLAQLTNSGNVRLKWWETTP